MINFSNKLKLLRQQRGLTQLQLAQQLNITKAMISAYETGSRYPSFDILIKLSSLFNVTTDYLLGLEKAKILDVSGLTTSQLNIVLALLAEFKKEAM